jgi:predicted dehydrogenase
MIKIGVIGYGYWGPNLVRTFAEAQHGTVVAVSDLDPKKLAQVNKRYPAVKTTNDFQDLLRDPEIDAVAIATPVSTHFEFGMAALKAGKHVWLEKPMTETSLQARKLCDEAAKRNLVVFVDHTFCYTGAVRKMGEVIKSGDLGRVYYYDSIRVNLGLFQRDVNVSWLAPVKVRQILLGGSKKMITYDDLEPSEKVKIYDKGINFTEDPKQIQEMRVGYRTGDMWAPKLDGTEALRLGGDHFIDCIVNKKTPLTDGLLGLRVVELIEAATSSMRGRGETVYIQKSEKQEKIA